MLEYEYVYVYGVALEPGDVAPCTRHRRLARSGGADVLVFATVGRYVEFFGPQRVLAQRVLGLRPVPIARFGWGLTAGFPVWHAARFAQRALAAGVGVLLPPRRSRCALTLMVPWSLQGVGPCCTGT